MKWALMGALAFGVSTAAATGYVAMQPVEETPVNADSAAVHDTSLVVEETPAHDEQQAEHQPIDEGIDDIEG